MLDAISKTIEVPCDARTAFDVFTEKVATWWPLDKNTLTAGKTGRPAKSLTIEPDVGGRIYETTPEDEQLHWGTILAYEPGVRLVFSWHVTCPESEATEVEVRFSEVGEARTRVDLEHRNWENMASADASVRDHFALGWDNVFVRCYAGAC